MTHDESEAAATNRAAYDRMWPGMSDFIRYNPGARHRREHVFALLQQVPFSSLLDVGCGDATLLRAIDARFAARTLHGVDLSSVVVQSNQRALPHIGFTTANLERDELPRGPWDVVVCSEVLEHLEFPERGLRAIAQVVAPGGHVVVTVPTGKVHATERHFGHVRHPTAETLRGWARAAQLDVVSVVNWGFPFYLATKYATNLSPGRALRTFGDGARYGLASIGVSTALYALNRLNMPDSRFGVQLFALLRRAPEGR